MTRARVLFVLLAAAWKVVPWRPLAGGGAVGLAVAAVPVAAHVRLDPGNHADLLRLAALAGALGAAFVLDDPAHAVVAVTPVRKPLRQGVRVAVALPLAAGWWTSVLLVGTLGMDPGVRQVMPLPGLTVEAMALFAVALTLGAAGMRGSGSTGGGVTSASVLLLTAVAAAGSPHAVNPLLPPGDPRWETAHDLLALLTAAMAIAFVLLGHERSGTRGQKVRDRWSTAGAPYG